MNTILVKQNVLTEHDLKLFLELQAEFKTFKENLEKLESDLKNMELELIARIDDGAALTTNQFVVSIREIERRFPAWKEHYIAIAGKDAADQVLNDTEAKLYRNLVIKAA